MLYQHPEILAEMFQLLDEERTENELFPLYGSNLE